jgi:hypothetical protein
VCVLANGLLPGAVVTTAAIALYTTIPLLIFARWRHRTKEDKPQ